MFDRCHFCMWIALFFLLPLPSYAMGVTEKVKAPPSALWIEEMTWVEVQAALDAGYTSILIPAAGIEQNGLHIPLNKHHKVVHKNAEAIAQKLGNTLIAPVMDYVPEGDIASRAGHMAFAGTISVPEDVFSAVITHTVHSLAAHGFTQFFIMGDSGSTQAAQAHTAKALQESNFSAYHIGDYYANAAQEGQLRAQGFNEEAIGGHAGLRDTSEFMYAAPDTVRTDKLGTFSKAMYREHGNWGETRKANAALGEQLADIKITRAIAQICRVAKFKAESCKQ